MEEELVEKKVFRTRYNIKCVDGGSTGYTFIGHPDMSFPPPVYLVRRTREFYLVLLAMKKSGQLLPRELVEMLFAHFVDRVHSCTWCTAMRRVEDCHLIEATSVYCSRACWEKSQSGRRFWLPPWEVAPESDDEWDMSSDIGEVDAEWGERSNMNLVD